MRPSTDGVAFILLVSIAFTALVAFDVLGLVWLVFGPGAGAAAEIAASFYFGDGAASSEQKAEPEVLS
jgi:hypothetical protein